MFIFHSNRETPKGERRQKMKIVVSKSELQKGVSIVSKAVPVRTTIPILECIKIDASEKDIKLIATDTQFGIETIIDGTIEERGIIALNARFFESVVNKLKDSDVTIETDEKYGTTITCDNIKLQMNGQSGEEFTPLPVVPKKNPIEISQLSLGKIIRQTIFSISDNEERKIMTGEQFKTEDDLLTVVSLDGHRISIRKLRLADAAPDYDVVISGKTLKEISKIISDKTDEKVKIYITDVPEEKKNEMTQYISFDFEKTTVVATLLPGKFFGVEHMIVDEYATKVKVDKKSLLDCIDRSTLFVKEGDKKPIIMNITDGNMELMISSMLGSMDENLMIEKEGEDVKIAFNPKFFIDALRAIDDDSVNLYFINSKSPCSIKDDTGTYLYMILPVNF